jgi:formylglycine-generating enzyme required for sulfatase activity
MAKSEGIVHAENERECSCHGTHVQMFRVQLTVPEQGGGMTPHTAGSMLVVALLLWTHLTAAADPVASTARQTMASAPQQPQAPPATLVGNDGAAMRLVPAGEFLMGSEADDLVRFALQQELVEDEMPRHRVYLDAFYMNLSHY